jgi:ABC-2 type transport system permease protein
MSLRSTARALPTMLKIGFSEAVAYRAELVVWILATTMPLIMLALWTAVARDAPIGRFGERQVTAYFLATFIVRQVTGSWAGWQINFEIRQGTLAMRLLRPVHPLVAYVVENVASMPFRAIIALPVAVIALLVVGSQEITRDPLLWVVFFAATTGGWLITLLANLGIGCLAFVIESSMKVLDLYLAAYMVFSGYIIPVELFPPGVKAVIAWLPFRYQIGLPVEILTGAYDGHAMAALGMVLRQWTWVTILFLLVGYAWRRGLASFSAYGG